MPALFSCNDIVALPTASDGWYAVRYAPLFDGSLAFLQTTTDMTALAQHYRNTHSKGLDDGQRSLFGVGGRARLSRIGDTDPPAEFHLEYPFIQFDRLPDGGWIVVNARCELGKPNNASRLGKGGDCLNRFDVGDGVQQIQADDIGGVWVSHFDEGVFGDDLGASGIAHFDASGRETWRANYDPAIPSVDDCYALNAVGSEAWACYYFDFPILRIRRSGEFHVWSNGVSGAAAIAVDGNYVVLFGGYGEHASRIMLLKLGTTAAALVGELRLVGPKVARNQVAGRGDTIHLIGKKTWRRFTVAEIVFAVTAAGKEANTDWEA